MFDFITITKSYYYFSHFMTSKQLNSNISRVTRLGLLYLNLIFLKILRYLMSLFIINIIQSISKSLFLAFYLYFSSLFTRITS